MAHKPLKKIYIDLAIIFIGFIVLGYLSHIPYLYIFSGIALISAIHPTTASWVSFGWEKFGKALGLVNSRIMLSIFYFVVITPFSLLYKLIGTKHKNGWKKVEKPEVNFNNPW